MNHYLSLLALAAGAAIATQASMNAQLGVLLKNPLIGTAIAFSCSSLFTLLAVLASTRQYPPAETLRAVPFYLWFSGGALSALAVAMFYYLIPKMGVGSMMSYALSGQIVVAIVASHFGWFELPSRPLDASRISGVLALILGIALINRS